MNYLQKAAQSFERCLSVINNLYGRLVSPLESPIIFEESFRVTSVALVVAKFN